MAMFQEECNQVMRAHVFFVFTFFLEILPNLQEKKSTKNAGVPFIHIYLLLKFNPICFIIFYTHT